LQVVSETCKILCSRKCEKKEKKNENGEKKKKNTAKEFVAKMQ